MPVARRSKKLRSVKSKSKSSSLKGGYQGVLIGKKNKYRKHLSKTKRKRKSRRAKTYKLNQNEVKGIMNTIWENYFEKQILSGKIKWDKAVETVKKFHPLLVNFEVMATKPKLHGAFGVIDLSKKDGVYHFCLNELEGYFKYGENESELATLKKYQKKGSPMKGGGYINYTFDLSSRISNMPTVMREYID